MVNRTLKFFIAFSSLQINSPGHLYLLFSSESENVPIIPIIILRNTYFSQIMLEKSTKA